MKLHESVITSLDLDTEIKRAELRRINAEAKLLELRALNQRNLSSHQYGLPGAVFELPSDAPVKSFKSVAPSWKLVYKPAENEIVIKTSADISGDAYLAITNVFNERWPKKTNN